MPRALVVKIAAVVVVAVVVVVGLVQAGGTSAEPTVQAFLLAWERGQYQTAAALTTGRPAAVTAALAGAYRQLDAADLVLAMGSITQHGDTAGAQFLASVDLGSGGLRWSYHGSFAMRRTSAGWKVVWSPSVIVPGLRQGDRLAVLTSMPSRAQIQDSAGKSLAVPSRVFVAGVRPGSLADPKKTAAALSAATGGLLDAPQVYGQIIAAPSREFLGLLRLRPSAHDRMGARLARVPGLQVRERTERLFESIAPVVTGSVGTETAQILRTDGVPYRPGATVGLSGLQEAYQRTLTGSATTKVVLENAAGHQVATLQSWTGQVRNTSDSHQPSGRGSPVRTTLDSRVQRAANHALEQVPESAAIVAIEPGTGRILAVAARRAAGMPAVSPLAGQYQPGQAFTIISTAALLQETGFDAAKPVPCRAENSVGGRRFANHPAETGLGSQPPFSVDFAHACGTAFAGLSLRLNASDLAAAAQDFGIGAAWRLQVTSTAGTIGNPAGFGQIAAASVGAGSVRVSPLDMALAAGLVQAGTWHAPLLVTSPPDPTLAARRPFSSQIVTSLRKLMHATVTKGAGHAANVGGGAVFGQVGTSRLGSAAKGLRSAWFVGYQGKVAFAVVEFTRSVNVSAAPLAGAFLQDIQG
jgi:cell division protein FtsI/penicillin-binding protein 2